MRKYPVIVEEDKKTRQFSVRFPDVPEAITFGATRQDAMLQAADALETALSFYVDSNQPFPKASRATKGQVAIGLSALGEAKAALYEGMRARKLGRAELARRTGWHLAQVDRVLDLTHDSRLGNVEKALRAIGLRLEVHAEAAE